MLDFVYTQTFIWVYKITHSSKNFLKRQLLENQNESVYEFVQILL